MELLTIIFILMFSLSGYASPLVFKTTKIITTNEVVELASFDASKYKQVRISVKALDRVNALPKEIAEKILNSAIGNLERASRLLESQVLSRRDYDKLKEQVDEAQKAYNDAVANTNSAGISGIEEGTEIMLYDFGEVLKQSINIDNPPSRISIKVYGKGTYKIFIWAY